MRYWLKNIVKYSPIVLLVGQLFANILYVAAPEVYANNYYWIATLFGVNLIGGLAIVAMTFLFEFCRISKWAAVSQVIFAIVYLCFTKDDEYNIAVQIIVGVGAILLTITEITIKSWEREKY